MESNLFERILTSLQEKRENLSAWLLEAPAGERQLRLGSAAEAAFHAHLETLDTAVEKSAARTLGTCEVCNETVESALLEMDYTCCVCLTHLSVAETRRLETELELAQSVQQTLLPERVPDIPGIELAAYSRPAQIVGGDYFDFFEFRDRSAGIAIADVAGHGMSASLHMASVQTLLRSLAPANVSPAAVAGEMQRLMSHNIRFTTFVTLFLAAYDPARRTLTYCNAGHNPPLLIRHPADGINSPAWLQPTGPAIGLVEEAKFHEDKVSLQPGDLLVFYTDGITEAANLDRETFGPRRLAATLSREAPETAGAAIRLIRESLNSFMAGALLEDDITLVVMRSTG